MSQVNVPLSYARSSINVPPELAGLLEPSEWQAVREALASGSQEGHCIACAIECIVCLVFSFPCIFCCHPCFATAFGRSQASNKITKLNRVVFGGQPVIHIMGDMVIVNASLIGRVPASGGSTVLAAAQVVQPQNVPLAEAEVMYSQNSAAKPSIGQRTMTVTVPEGAGPGYTLKVTAPDGSTVSLVVPENVKPGQNMTVQY